MQSRGWGEHSPSVESMLAWQHPQLVFHFEVLQTHGTCLLHEGAVRQTQIEVNMGHCLASVSAQVHSYPMKIQLFWISF